MCLRPLTVKNPKKARLSSDFSSVKVPCGKCYECRKKRIDDWCFRLRAEEFSSPTAHFVTLTYNPEHVPISPNGFMTLSKSDVQNFHKRLRKLSSFKYFTAGEYGGRTTRPHYHGIYFGVLDSSYFGNAWSLGGEPLGNVHIGTVTSRSIGYCLKYIHKRQFRKMFARDDRQFEFSLKSNGLGLSFMTPAMKRYLVDNLDNFSTSKDGFKIGVPRYFKEKFFTSAQSKMITYHQVKRYMLKSDEYARWFYMKYGNNTPLSLSYDDYVIYMSWLLSQDDGSVSMIEDRL